MSAAFDPAYGRLIDLGGGVARLTAPNAGPYTGAGTNTYVIGERRVMVVDPGPDDEAHREALLAAVAGRTVTHILVTHTHKDHVAGLPALAAAVGAPTVGEGPHRDARPLKPGEVNPFLYAAALDFRPDITVADGETVDNGEVAMTALATPGHTANHLCFGLGDTCFSGDHVMGWSTTVIAPPDGSMSAYLSSLDRLLERADRRYLPGHGDAIAEPAKAVSAMKTHRLMREAAILERVRGGDRSVRAMVDALYVGLDPRLVPAAELSVLAHLEKLEEEGRVRADGHGVGAVWHP